MLYSDAVTQGPEFFSFAPWIIFFPVCGLLLNMFFGSRFKEKTIGILASSASGLAFVVSALLAHVDDPAWREVSLLTVGYLGLVQERDKAASSVVEELLKDTKTTPGSAVVLAGEAVADAQPAGGPGF